MASVGFSGLDAELPMSKKWPMYSLKEKEISLDEGTTQAFRMRRRVSLMPTTDLPVLQKTQCLGRTTEE